MQNKSFCFLNRGGKKSLFDIKQETASDLSPIFSEPKFGQESSSDKRPLRTRVRLPILIISFSTI